ncbi:hypothetical protein ECDEC7B_5167 [Escherichia coli DEC7B]|nr:hypothetical protein ECDEC7B_5167 [Escherichia coli DEC7B]
MFYPEQYNLIYPYQSFPEDYSKSNYHIPQPELHYLGYQF